MEYSKLQIDPSRNKLLRRRRRQLRSLILGLLRIPFYGKKCHIKRGYIHRQKNFHFSAVEAKEDFQKEVYETAKLIAERNGFNDIIDLGCGGAYKLLKNFPKPYNTIGLDIGDTLQWLKETYPDRRWMDALSTDYSTLNADLVICSDVIEHVPDPDLIIQNMKAIKGAQYYVISTPDRKSGRGWYDFGPPNNLTHIREWSFDEFAAYLSDHFEIISHEISNAEQHCQMVICKPLSNA